MKLKNPPPKRIKFSKNLGYETLKFLNYLDFRFTTARDALDYDDIKRTAKDTLCALRAHWSTWWQQEKQKRKEPKI